MKLGKNLEGKTIMITGGTGSFGYQMTERLLKIPETNIVIYSRDEDKQRVMKSYFSELVKDPERIRFVLGDLRDEERLIESMKGIDIVLHAGALKQIPAVEFNPMEAIKTNTLSAYSIMKASEANNVEQVIAISTDKACMPANSYGASKMLMEKIITGEDVWSDLTKFCCVRYGNVLGSRGSVLPVWDKLISEDKPIPITSNSMRRFFITLDQATDLILYASNQTKGREIFVRSAPAIKISDLANVYAEIKTGKKNYPQKVIGIRSGEKLDEVLISQEEMAKTTKQKQYFVINTQMKDSKRNDFSEYSSANTEQLNKKQIMNLIKDLKWKK